MTHLAFSPPLPLSAPRRHTRTNYRHCTRTPSASASASASAARTHARPIFSPAAAPAWDSAHISSPVVQRYLSDDGSRYVMWYTGRAKDWTGAASTPPGSISGSTGLALSDNGIDWQRVQGPHQGAVLTPNAEDWWWFDTTHLAVGDVAIDSNDRVRADSGVYFMYYSGGDKEVLDVPMPNDGALVQAPGLRTRIGVALSKDGEYFTRIEGDFPSGAVVDVGETGEFDELFVASPTVVRPVGSAVSDKYVMHYYTYNLEVGEFMVGCAVSADGFLFRKREGPVLKGSGSGSGLIDEKGVCRCNVVQRKEGGFVMFVEVVDGRSTHRIAMCESADCRNWGPLQLVLDVGEAGAWDEACVSHPNAVVLDDDSVRLYYVGRAKGEDGMSASCIGLAESDGSNWTKFERIN